ERGPAAKPDGLGRNRSALPGVPNNRRTACRARSIPAQAKDPETAKTIATPRAESGPAASPGESVSPERPFRASRRVASVGPGVRARGGPRQGRTLSALARAVRVIVVSLRSSRLPRKRETSTHTALPGSGFG